MRTEYHLRLRQLVGEASIKSLGAHVCTDSKAVPIGLRQEDSLGSLIYTRPRRQRHQRCCLRPWQRIARELYSSCRRLTSETWEVLGQPLRGSPPGSNTITNTTTTNTTTTTTSET